MHKIKTVDIDEINKNARNYIENLRKNSKPLEELVVSENFIVEEVLSQSEAKSLTPHSEMIVGGKSQHYDTGYSSLTRLKVNRLKTDSSIDDYCNVHLLNFRGYSIVKAGDRITVKIPRYEKKEIQSGMFPVKNEIFYFDREFGLEENTIEIIIKSNDDKKLRIDRSVDYHEFL